MGGAGQGCHSQHQDITWLREIPTCKVRCPDGYQYQPAWINPVDAAERDIKNGDVVKVCNDRGAFLAGAYITERVVPGEFDRGGATNPICPHKTTSRNATGMAVSGFLIEVERADSDQLRRQYPEAFKRPFHPAADPSLESFVEGK